uniref:C-type lectin domain-containing protein n=1 Tax=Anas platyrhynchos TaxID=8839 RepID=A0A8B9ZFN9_ANAPL
PQKSHGSSVLHLYLENISWTHQVVFLFVFFCLFVCFVGLMGLPASPLTQLTSPTPASGAEGCWLCPAGWQPFATKCYWVSAKTLSWEEAGGDCKDRRAELVMLKSVEEKNFIGAMSKEIPGSWTGLSTIPTQGEEWTWMDGSPLQDDLNFGSGGEQMKFGQCGPAAPSCSARRGRSNQSIFPKYFRCNFRQGNFNWLKRRCPNPGYFAAGVLL